jgi:prepilin-type N-terminal cleavage/methylation domain-containing protein
MSPMSRRRDRGPAGLICPDGQTGGDASLAGSGDGVCSCTGSLARRLPASGDTEKTRGRTCGFSLAEVLVALAVAAMMAAVLTRYVAGIRFNAAQVRERLELWTIAQSMLDGLSKTISPGTSEGQIGAYRWHREIASIASDAVARTEAPGAEGGLEDHLRLPGGPRTAAPSTTWVLYRIKVQIEAPSGRQYEADTIRITRPQTNTR